MSVGNKKLEEIIIGLSKAVEELSVSLSREQKTAPTHKQRRSEGLSEVKMDYSPTPLARNVRSSAQCLEDIYFQQGQIDRETWEQLKGIEYDSYGAIDDDTLAMQKDSEDEFEQSSFASYHDFKRPSTEKPLLEVPNVETNEPDIAPAPNTPEVSPPQPAQGASEQGGVK